MPKKDIVVTVRNVPYAIVRAIEKKAQELGVTRTAYVRMMLMEAGQKTE